MNVYHLSNKNDLAAVKNPCGFFIDNDHDTDKAVHNHTQCRNHAHQHTIDDEETLHSFTCAEHERMFEDNNTALAERGLHAFVIKRNTHDLARNHSGMRSSQLERWDQKGHKIVIYANATFLADDPDIEHSRYCPCLSMEHNPFNRHDGPATYGYQGDPAHSVFRAGGGGFCDGGIFLGSSYTLYQYAYNTRYTDPLSQVNRIMNYSLMSEEWWTYRMGNYYYSDTNIFACLKDEPYFKQNSAWHTNVDNFRDTISATNTSRPPCDPRSIGHGYRPRVTLDMTIDEDSPMEIVSWALHSIRNGPNAA